MDTESQIPKPPLYKRISVSPPLFGDKNMAKIEETKGEEKNVNNLFSYEYKDPINQLWGEIKDLSTMTKQLRESCPFKGPKQGLGGLLEWRLNFKELMKILEVSPDNWLKYAKLCFVEDAQNLIRKTCQHDDQITNFSELMEFVCRQYRWDNVIDHLRNKYRHLQLYGSAEDMATHIESLCMHEVFGNMECVLMILMYALPESFKRPISQHRPAPTSISQFIQLLYIYIKQPVPLQCFSSFSYPYECSVFRHNNYADGIRSNPPTCDLSWKQYEIKTYGRPQSMIGTPEAFCSIKRDSRPFERNNAAYYKRPNSSAYRSKFQSRQTQQQNNNNHGKNNFKNKFRQNNFNQRSFQKNFNSESQVNCKETYEQKT